MRFPYTGRLLCSKWCFNISKLQISATDHVGIWGRDTHYTWWVWGFASLWSTQPTSDLPVPRCRTRRSYTTKLSYTAVWLFKYLCAPVTTVVAVPKTHQALVDKPSESAMFVAIQAWNEAKIFKLGAHRPYMSATSITRPLLEARWRRNTHPQEVKSHAYNTVSVSPTWTIWIACWKKCRPQRCTRPAEGDVDTDRMRYLLVLRTERLIIEREDKARDARTQNNPTVVLLAHERSLCW